MRLESLNSANWHIAYKENALPEPLIELFNKCGKKHTDTQQGTNSFQTLKNIKV